MKDGPNVDIETYAFVTTTPHPLVATINHERSAVDWVDESDTWLRGSQKKALALGRAYPPDTMRMAQEGLFKEDRERSGELADAILGGAP